MCRATKTMSLILIVIFLGLPSLSFAATRCVNPDGSSGCDSVIQNAINASVNGDTILIYPDTYDESLIINKSLTIRGMGGPNEVNLIAPTGNAITMATGSSNTSIMNLTITASAGNGISSYYPLNVALYIRNCVIQNCSGAAIYKTGPSTFYISNCIIFNNSGQGSFNDAYGGSGGFAYLYSNIIYQNHGAGISRNYYSTNVNEYNCVFGNNPNYGTYSSPGTGDFSSDPQFVNADSGDFHLQSSSPCINTGRPGPAYLDCDGSFNDMGVYGGPYAWCGPGPVVTDLQIIPSTVVRGETFRIQATGVSR